MPLTPTGARDLSIKLAERDPRQALVIARKIKDGWFKCQALSEVARHWPDRDYVRLLDEAIVAADSQDDPYNRAAVASWPIRTYLERGETKAAASLLSRYIRIASQLENLGSRSEALMSLFLVTRPFDRQLWEPAFWALVEAGEPSLAWRQGRNLRFAVPMAASEDPQLLDGALAKLSDPRTVSAIHREMAKQRQG